ncbi:MAG: hypothetical protein RLZZ462_225 [Bacteroidota bacterium]
MSKGLIIFDVQGKQLYKNSSCNVIIPSEKFKPGVYFACVKSGEIRKTKKFIIRWFQVANAKISTSIIVN